MTENEVSRWTFENKFAASGPIFFLDSKLDQRLDSLKDLLQLMLLNFKNLELQGIELDRRNWMVRSCPKKSK